LGENPADRELSIYNHGVTPLSRKSDLSEKRILVVDDNEDIRNLISIILGGGYEVRAVGSGTEALAIYEEFRPDLVLLDIMMPEVSGFEVLMKIRDLRSSKLNSVPIVMITAKSMTEDIDKAIELGANSYIVKPFRAETLKQKIDAYLLNEE